MRQIQIRTHRLVNTGLSGGYRSTFRGQGIEFEEVRPYQPGDEVRAIDWNVTARTGEPYIKSYREERQLTIHLCVDTALELDFATFGETKRDAASEVAALISFVGIRHQDRIGLTLFGSEPELHLSPGRQSRHVLRLIREIQAAPITPGPSSLRSLLEGQEATIGKRSMVFLISDFSGVGADGSERGDRGWIDSLGRLAARHDVIAIRLVDRFEEELPRAGVVRLARMEDGAIRDVDGRKARVREAWSEAAKARRAALNSVFRRAGAEWIDMRTDGDLGAPLVRFFRQRAQAPAARSASASAGTSASPGSEGAR
ncbi:MAG: DUF58 domain-containing protein [Planctomycetota bacterium]